MSNLRIESGFGSHIDPVLCSGLHMDERRSVQKPSKRAVAANALPFARRVDGRNEDASRDSGNVDSGPADQKVQSFAFG